MNGNSNLDVDYGRFFREIFRRNVVGAAIVIALLILLLIGVLSALYSVEADGEAVVKRFGRVVGVSGPGLHVKIPFGVDKAYFVPTKRVLKEEFGFRTVRPDQRTQYAKTDVTSQESLMLTGDLNVIDVEWVVQYRIIDPDKYLHRVRRQTETIRDIAEAVMRRIIGNRLGRDVLTTGRVGIAAEARSEMQRILKGYDNGVRVETVELQDVTPPDPVKPAFNEVNEARQQKERLINEAEKYRNQMIPKARGEAAQTVAESEAYHAERTNKAKGEAERFTAILAEYRQAKDVTRRRLFLEMIDDVLPRLGKVYVIDPSQAGPLPLLNLDRPQGNAARRTP